MPHDKMKLVSDNDAVMMMDASSCYLKGRHTNNIEQAGSRT